MALAITDIGIRNYGLPVGPNKAIELLRVGRSCQEQSRDEISARDSRSRVLKLLDEGIETLRHHVGQHERPVPRGGTPHSVVPRKKVPVRVSHATTIR